MSDMELMEIEFTETTVETDNVWLNLAINFGVTIAGVLAGKAVVKKAQALTKHQALKKVLQ